MGRFSSVVLLLLAACADNLGDDGSGSPPLDQIEPGDTATATPRYVPAVCASETWKTNLADAGAMKVSVSPRPSGAVALVAPREGGALVGFVLDTRMQMLTGSKVAISETVSEVTAWHLGKRVVAAGAHDGAVYLNLVDEDFTNPELVAKLPGRVLPEDAFFTVQQDVVMPVGDHDGVWLHRFDDSLEPHGSTQLLATDPVQSIAAAQMGDTLLTAWSTDHDCYMARTSTLGPSVSTHTTGACVDPRIAVDPSTTNGVMVFDTEDGVQLMDINAIWTGGPARVLREDTYAPRTVFDGTNFWVSYLDARGDVVVGFLDGQGTPVTVGLAGTRPEASAYELVMVDGAPWVFALASDGYTAHRMCIDTLE